MTGEYIGQLFNRKSFIKDASRFLVKAQVDVAIFAERTLGKTDGEMALKSAVRGSIRV